MEAFGRLLDVLDNLREKCPWDAKQTNESLRPQTVEEVYELCDALMKDEPKEICKELGDVLLHVCFYAKIGSEKRQFDIADVCNKLCDKLIFRHPHVYGDAVAASAGEVVANWEKIKQREKDGNRTVLSGVPAALPSVIKAYRIQDKARNVGFDWEKREESWDKGREEMGELQAELAREDREKSTDEFGDFLFSLINVARLYHINPDNALERTNQKFIRRFNYVEARAKEQGLQLQDMTLAQMDALKRGQGTGEGISSGMTGNDKGEPARVPLYRNASRPHFEAKSKAARALNPWRPLSINTLISFSVAVLSAPRPAARAWAPRGAASGGGRRLRPGWLCAACGRG